MAAANRELIRAINRFKILHTIRNHGRISRVEIAKATGLSQASVTGITADHSLCEYRKTQFNVDAPRSIPDIKFL